MKTLETALRDQDSLARRMLMLNDEQKVLHRALVRWRLASAALAILSVVMAIIAWGWPA